MKYLSRILLFVLLVHAFPATAAQIHAGGTNGQIQYNNNGAFGGESAGAVLDVATNPVGTAGQWLTRLAAGSWKAIPAAQVLGECNYVDYFVANNLTETTVTQHTTNFQNWLLDCQLKAFKYRPSTAGDNITQRSCIKATYPRGGAFLGETTHINSPLIIPPYICTNFQEQILREGSATGTAPATYTGLTTAVALRNLSQPTVIYPPLSHNFSNLSINTNTNGADNGSGVYFGKNWTPATATVVAPGSGYAPGDVVTLAQPSNSPYVSPQVTVSTVDGSGGITGFTFTRAGSYSLPPIMQQTQYNSAGWTALYTPGTIATSNVGQVFDAVNPTWYLSSGSTGAGTGAKFTLTWTDDFTAAHYNTGAALIAQTIVGDMGIEQCGLVPDGTYGPKFCLGFGGLNYEVGEIETVGGTYGIWFNGAADIHGGSFNPVNPVTGVKVERGGSFNSFYIIDTPSKDCFEIDGTSQFVASGYAINIGSGLTGLGCLVIGGDTNYSDATHKASGINFNFSMNNVGGTGVPGLYLDYMTGANSLNVNISNTRPSGATVTNPSAYFAQFGTNNTSVGQVTGSIDASYTSVFNGNATNDGIRVWDGINRAWAQGFTSTKFNNAGVTTFSTGVQGSTNVNYIQAQSNATGLPPGLQAVGTDTNVGMQFKTQGTGGYSFSTGASPTNQFSITNTNTAVNRISVTGSTTGNQVQLTALGSDTDIGVAFSGKGAGVLRMNSHISLGGSTPTGPSTCGTGSPTVSGNDMRGVITTGTGATACTITFASTWAATPVCMAITDSTASLPFISAISTGAVTFGLTGALTGHIYYHCFQ